MAPLFDAVGNAAIELKPVYRFDGSRLESRSQIAESVEQLRNLLEI